MNKIKSNSFFAIFFPPLYLCVCRGVRLGSSWGRKMNYPAMWNHVWFSCSNNAAGFSVFKGETILVLVTWPNHRVKVTKLSAQTNRIIRVRMDADKHTKSILRVLLSQDKCMSRGDFTLYEAGCGGSVAVCPRCHMAQSWRPSHLILAIFRPGASVKPDLSTWPLMAAPLPPTLTSCPHGPLWCQSIELQPSQTDKHAEMSWPHSHFILK